MSCTLLTIFYKIVIGDLLMPIRQCSSMLQCCRFLMSDVNTGRILVYIGKHIFCSDAPIACLLFNLVQNSVIHSPFFVIRDPRYGNTSICSSCSEDFRIAPDTVIWMRHESVTAADVAPSKERKRVSVVQVILTDAFALALLDVPMPSSAMCVGLCR